MRFCITRSSFSSAEGFHFLFYSLLQVSPAYRSDFARKLCSSNFTFSYGCRTEVSHRLLVSEVVFLSLLSFFFFTGFVFFGTTMFLHLISVMCAGFLWKKCFSFTHLWFLFSRIFLFVRVNCSIQFRFLITYNKIHSHLQRRKCFRIEMSAALRCIRRKVNSCEKHL